MSGPLYFDMVEETTSTGGTGTFALAGATVGHQSWSAKFSNGDTGYYTARGTTFSEWEVGLGTIGGGGTTLARTTVLDSSNGGAAVNFTGTVAAIRCNLPAEAIRHFGGPVASSALTMTTARILGRTSPSTGAVEEIAIGTGLDLTAGVLSSTGGTGGAAWGSIVGTLSAQSDLQTALNAKLDSDATLSALAGQNWALNSVPVGTGADTVAQTALTTNTVLGRGSSGNVAAKPVTDLAYTLLNNATTLAMQTTIGVVPGGTYAAQGLKILRVNAAETALELATPSAGTGTVTNTGGVLTSNAVVLGAAGADAKVVAGITTDGTSQITLGVNATTIGKIKLFGNTSGDVTIQPNAVAGTGIVLTLPATTGTIVTGGGTASGTNTGDQTSVTGNAGTATALLNARTIGGVSFDGTANITVATATGGFTVSGGNLALGTNSLTLTGSIASTGSRVTKGWFTDLETTNAMVGSITGNAATASAVAVGGITGLGTGVATALAVNVGSAGAPVVLNGAGGTPSSITLTNGTGLPIAGLTASTSAALGIGSVELGHATDTTVSRSGSGKIAVEGKAVPLASGAFDIVFAGPTAARTYTFPDADTTFSASATGKPFSANKNGTNQTGVTPNTYVKVTFTTEAFDVGGYYDDTNSKWTPPAGKIAISAVVCNDGANSAGGDFMLATVYKNGSQFFGQTSTQVSTNGEQAYSVFVIDDANGTDYYEIYVFFSTSGGNKTIKGAADRTRFQGFTL